MRHYALPQVDTAELVTSNLYIQFIKSSSNVPGMPRLVCKGLWMICTFVMIFQLLLLVLLLLQTATVKKTFSFIAFIAFAFFVALFGSLFERI